MTFTELEKNCTDAIASKRPAIMLTVDGRNAPFPRKGWPRAELLCVNQLGQSTWLYDARKMLVALHRNAAIIGTRKKAQ